MNAKNFGDCPQCDQTMRIESLGCWRCGTCVTGQIGIPLLARLPREQADFVVRFLTANGSLSGVQTEMGCSYPKVRRLLNLTMDTLRAELERSLREKEEILEAIDEQTLDGAQAAQLLRGLVGVDDE